MNKKVTVLTFKKRKHVTKNWKMINQMLAQGITLRIEVKQ
jgi:hypothetical protein